MLGEGFVAHTAFVGFLVGMDPLVRGLVGMAGEGFGAECAQVGPLVCMNSLVSYLLGEKQ